MNVLEHFYSCTMELDEDYVPAYMYEDWVVYEDLAEGGWLIEYITSDVYFPYVFSSALGAALFASMLNGFHVDWDNLGKGDLTRIGEIVTPLYLSRYREYTSVNAA